MFSFTFNSVLVGIVNYMVSVSSIKGIYEVICHLQMGRPDWFWQSFFWLSVVEWEVFQVGEGHWRKWRRHRWVSTGEWAAGCVQERARRLALPRWSAERTRGCTLEAPGELVKLPLPRLHQLTRVSGAISQGNYNAIWEPWRWKALERLTRNDGWVGMGNRARTSHGVRYS